MNYDSSRMPNTYQVAGANRRWRGQFRCRGSRRESAVAQLSTLGGNEIRDVFATVVAEFLHAAATVAVSAV